MRTDETLSGKGFFFAENAAGNVTAIRITDVSSIVTDRERQLVIVGMNNGKEFGFKTETIKAEYDKWISAPRLGLDPSYILFKLLCYIKLPSQAY